MSSDQTKSRPSPIIISSSDEEDHSSDGGDKSVFSVEDGSDESDCAIMDVEELRREEKWRPRQSVFKKLNSLIQAGFSDPRTVLTHVFGLDDESLPSDTHHLWNLLLTILAEPVPRRRLRHINNLEHVLQLLTNSKSILVITGAGVSVSCGIPDFRSRDGIYARLSRDFPDLSNPQAMFDMSYFRKNPVPFFKFATELFPGQFSPSLTHRLIALLESKSKLLRNYTQNIDTLEQAAGITRLIQCHGSFASATCTTCGHKVSCEDIRDSILAKSIPHCPICWPAKSVDSTDSLPNQADADTADEQPESRAESDPVYGVLKPDIVFFGEGLSNEFHDTLAEDVKATDLVVVIGSSLKVRPVAHIPHAIPSHIPQILINREPLANHTFDVELLGDCDVIIGELCNRLNWHLDGLEMRTPLTEAPLNTLREQVCDITTQNGSELVVKNGSESVTVSSVGADNPSASKSDSTSESADKVVAKSANVDDEQQADVCNDSTKASTEQAAAKDDFRKDEVWEVASSLPPNSFTRIHPNQYVFPGAEIYLDNNIDLNCSCDTHSDTSSESDSSCGEDYVSNEGNCNNDDADSTDENDNTNDGADVADGNDSKELIELSTDSADIGPTEVQDSQEPPPKRPHCELLPDDLPNDRSNLHD